MILRWPEILFLNFNEVFERNPSCIQFIFLKKVLNNDRSNFQRTDLSETTRFGSLALVGISILMMFSLLFELLIWLDFDWTDNWLALIWDFDAKDVIWSDVVSTATVSGTDFGFRLNILSFRICLFPRNGPVYVKRFPSILKLVILSFTIGNFVKWLFRRSSSIRFSF